MMSPDSPDSMAIRKVTDALLHERIRRVVFLRTDRLGETILNLPAAASVKAALPTVSLTFVAHPEVAPLLQRLPWIDAVVPYDEASGRSWWGRALELRALLRARRCDVAIISNAKKELHLAVWLAGIPQRVGYDRKWGRWLLTHRLRDQRVGGARHEVEWNLDLVRALGLPVNGPTWRMPSFDEEWEDVRRRLTAEGLDVSRPWLIIHPWTSNVRKQWPPERYRALIAQIRSRMSHAVVLVGGAEAQADAASVIPAGVPMANLIGRLSLVQLAACLKHARMLISSDSGPVHLAAAMGTPTLVLFGTSDVATGPRRWGPWGEGHVVICKPTMDAITVEDVVAALQRHLA